MIGHHCLLLIKKLNEATIHYHAHGSALIITKHCGGTPVSFASILFNLDNEQVSTVNIHRFNIFRYFHSTMTYVMVLRTPHQWLHLFL